MKALTISGFDLEQIDEDVEDNFSILVVLFYNNHLILNAEKYHLSGYQYKAIIQSNLCISGRCFTIGRQICEACNNVH